MLSPETSTCTAIMPRLLILVRMTTVDHIQLIRFIRKKERPQIERKQDCQAGYVDLSIVFMCV